MGLSVKDIEKSENLLQKNPEQIVYHSREQYMGMTCCLIISYSMFYGLGFFSGYMNNVCDGSGM